MYMGAKVCRENPQTIYQKKTYYFRKAYYQKAPFSN
jgi:hypothetical protein